MKITNIITIILLYFNFFNPSFAIDLSLSQKNELDSKLVQSYYNEKFDDVIAYSTILLDYDSKSGLYYYFRSCAYMANGNFEKGLLDANNTIKYSPTFYGGYFARAFIKFSLNKFDNNALIDINSAIKYSNELDTSERSLLYLTRALIKSNLNYDRNFIEEDLDVAKKLSPAVYEEQYNYIKNYAKQSGVNLNNF